MPSLTTALAGKLTDVSALEADRAILALNKAADAFQQRALPRAVGAYQGERFSTVERKR